MLVLTRKVGEQIVIKTKDDVEIGRIVVVDNREGRVRLGFNFPQEFRIWRADVDERRQEQDDED